MLSLVLQHLESLELDLAAIDPTSRTDAADVVADMAVALRDLLAQADRAVPIAPSHLDNLELMPLQAAG